MTGVQGKSWRFGFGRELVADSETFVEGMNMGSSILVSKASADGCHNGIAFTIDFGLSFD